MQVLWWLVPPLMTTALAMLWAAWVGRARDDIRRDDSDLARQRMQKALARPTPHPSSRSRAEASSEPARQVEPSHGVVLRRASRPQPSPNVSR